VTEMLFPVKSSYIFGLFLQ